MKQKSVTLKIKKLILQYGFSLPLRGIDFTFLWSLWNFWKLTWENYFRSHLKNWQGGDPRLDYVVAAVGLLKQFQAWILQTPGTASYLDLKFLSLGALGPPAGTSW